MWTAGRSVRHSPASESRPKMAPTQPASSRMSNHPRRRNCSRKAVASPQRSCVRVSRGDIQVDGCVLQLEPRPQLYDPIGWDVEVERGAAVVALHDGEEADAEARQERLLIALLRRNDGRAAEVIRRAVGVDGDAELARTRQDVRRIRLFHEAIAAD